MPTFETKLAPPNAERCGGFGASGSIDPSEWADELYKGEVPGPWLCCYMLRRFGWPNAASDDYKNLCSWLLTTPIKGLYLNVTPYLGGSSLHFAVRFNEKVRSRINKDPGRKSYWLRRQKAVWRWWNKTGSKLYTFGCGTVEGDDDVLVQAYSEVKDGEVWGLWKRVPEHARFKNNLPKGILWWLDDFIRTKHPEAKLPKMNKREQAARVSRYDIAVRAAIKATLKDLLRPTYVRDVSFTVFGNIESTPEAIERYTDQSGTGYWEGAGNTPAYWFKHGKIEQRKRRKKS